MYFCPCLIGKSGSTENTGAKAPVLKIEDVLNRDFSGILEITGEVPDTIAPGFLNRNDTCGTVGKTTGIENTVLPVKKYVIADGNIRIVGKCSEIYKTGDAFYIINTYPIDADMPAGHVIKGTTTSNSNAITSYIRLITNLNKRLIVQYCTSVDQSNGVASGLVNFNRAGRFVVEGISFQSDTF